MKKGIICILVFMLLITTTFVAVAHTKSQSYLMIKGDTLYVGGVGPNNYTKIQDAVNDAVSGDTIFVYDDSSPYYENIIIEKSITLTGENRETTSILGDESADEVIVNISADDVSISGFTIQPNEGQPTGILVTKKYIYPDYWNMEIIQNVTIFNNIITKTGHPGIFGMRLNHGNIYGNDIKNIHGGGIILFISSNNTISNNVISACSDRGIVIDGLWGPYRLQNYLNPVPENNVISQNTIRWNRWGIELNSGPVNTNISDNNITENYETGIQIYDAYNTKITQNNFINNEKNAYFATAMPLRYPRFLKNTWDNNYWDEPKSIFVRIDGALWFLLIPRIPIGISFPNFDLTQWELPWIVFDKHPAQEPYDIPLVV
jgi:parallel beta-helix repeat protein